MAFNRAFAEFGLPDRWDVPTYRRLLATTGGRRRVAQWLRERGHPEQQVDELARALHARKTELFRAACAAGEVPERPGASRLLDEIAAAGLPVGAATTGSRAWVEPLLERCFGLDRFVFVLTGDDVAHRKPDPVVYHIALRRLGCDAPTVAAVEDSSNGLRAARAAGLPCLVVANDDTRDQDLGDAAVVTDGFGDDRPANVLRGPPDALEGGRVTLATLHRVVALQARSAGEGGSF